MVSLENYSILDEITDVTHQCLKELKMGPKSFICGRCNNMPSHVGLLQQQLFQVPSDLCVMNPFPSDSILLAIQLLGTRKHRLR